MSNRTSAIIEREDRVLSDFTRRAAARSTKFGTQMWKDKLSYLLSSPGLTVVLNITEYNPRLSYAFRVQVSAINIVRARSKNWQGKNPRRAQRALRVYES